MMSPQVSPQWVDTAETTRPTSTPPSLPSESLWLSLISRGTFFFLWDEDAVGQTLRSKKRGSFNICL